MAVAIVIITLLLGSIVVPLQTQVENRKYSETQRILDQARDALIGYASAYGYFPCPADNASNGQEAPGTNHAAGSGNCPTWNGFLPAATLGLTPVDARGYALDAWGLAANRIRYAVWGNQMVNGVLNPFTSIKGMQNAGMSKIADATLLSVCSSGTGVGANDCGAATILTSNAPVVIWSLGANASTGGTSTDEAENLDGDRVFVWHTKSTVAGNEFDDVVTWVSPSTLFNRLIAAGQLP